MRNIIIRLIKTKDQEKNYKLDWRKNIRHNLLKETIQDNNLLLNRNKGSQNIRE